MAVAAALCPLSLQSLQEYGKPLVGAKVYIYESGTTTPKTVFKDFQCQVAHARPILTNAQGRIPPIYVGSGVYRVRILRPDNVPFEDVDGIVGTVLEDGGSGSDPGQTYPLTDENSVLITGDVIWSYRSGPRPGFTPCNGGTIGQATSGASNIAVGVPSNQIQPVGSAFSLFKHLWESDPDLPICASDVDVPRGGTALADWDANRTIRVPDLRGRALFGLDNMSNASANCAQITTQLTTEKGKAEAVVADASGLCRGMYVVVSGIPNGTMITEIDGLTITLSALPTSTLTQKSARFSVFPDAQKLGSKGGSAVHILAQGELASHIHEATSVIEEADGAHPHNGATNESGDHAHGYLNTVYDGPGIFPGGGPIGPREEARTTYPAGNHAHAVTIPVSGAHKHDIKTEMEETGKSQPHNNYPPAVMGTFYMKL